MRNYRTYLFTGSAMMVWVVLLVALPVSLAAKDKDWHFNGTVIEVCRCPMFCSCYFNTEPALNVTEHGAEPFCKFTMAYKINEGHHGDTDLAGVKYWVAGDRGASWKNGNTDWRIITFQTGTTDTQKVGVTSALNQIFPVKWKSSGVAEDAEIEWMATEDHAEAKLAGGAKGHNILNRWQGMGGETGEFKNIAYFAAPRNSGFKMMPNEIETWKVGDKTFTFKGTTGCLTTIEYEPGVVADRKDAIERLAPRDAYYAHEEVWHDGNGHSHVQAALLGPSLHLPVRQGRLRLGTWQQVVVINHDNRSRRRPVEVTVMGVF